MRKICLVKNCNNFNYSFGWCNKHYQTFKRNGHPTKYYREMHGRKYTTEYRIWEQIKRRCYNKNQFIYKWYGGRGIKMCNKWKKSFLAFYKDVGDRPSIYYSLDRIDNSKGYNPNNVRWVDNRKQQTNRTNNVKYPGVYLTKEKTWLATIMFKRKSYYLGTFKKKNDAIKARKKAEQKFTYTN